MPITKRVFGMALLVNAARIICRVMDKYGTKILLSLDGPEQVAVIALQAACEQFKATFPLND